MAENRTTKPAVQVRLLRLTQSLARQHFFFDGSQDWVIAHNDVAAGSSPASGTKCRSSSVVEHVNSQFVSYPSVFQRVEDYGLSDTVGWWFKSALAFRRE